MQLNVRFWEDVIQEDRFYPEQVPVFEFEPLRQHYKIVKSPEAVNEGIISLISLNVDDIAFKWTGWSISFQTLHSLQVTPTKFVHDPYFSGKLLHSCSPNLRLDMSTLTVYVIKPILVFDTLTCDYEATEDQLYNKFNCKCGTPECRGWIEGRVKS